MRPILGPISGGFIGAGRAVDLVSLPSLEDRPRSATITATAVIPNEITIAVSTSACGSGSA